MKLLLYVLIFLAPFLYPSMLFQGLPLLLRGYLPFAVAAALFIRSRPLAWGAGIFSAILLDVLLAPAPGIFLLFHALFLGSLYITRGLFFQPSPVGMGVFVAADMLVLEIVYFLLLLILGWKVPSMPANVYVMMPLSTAVYTAVFATGAADAQRGYRRMGRNADE